MKLKKYLLTTALASLMAAALIFAGCDKKSDNGGEEAVATEAPKEDDTKKDDAGKDDTKEELEDQPTEAPAEEPETSELSLKDAYKNYFSIGVAVNSWQLADPDTLAVITKDFSSITTENEMKPDYVLDHDASMDSEDGMPVINTEKMDEIMTMAEDAGLKMRGHTLIWHSQTPEWLFCEGYEDGNDYVDRDTMLARMESFIKQMVEYAQNEHPGTLYAWDVVNEAIDEGDGFLREDSKWYETIGEDYVEKAFEFARKYANDDVKLFYNDYNATDGKKSKKIYELISKIYEQGNIDGIGMQSHYDVKYYAPASLESALYKYAQLEGLEIQLTEMDLHYNDNSEESMKDQADKYKEVFKILVELDKNDYANITNVTFWGLNDANTWLTGFKGETSYPLLLDENNEPKPCYYSVIEAATE